jgi:hypothetical protein
MGNTTGKGKERSMSKKDYDIKYQKQNIRRINLALHKEKDKDIIEYLDSLDNVNGEIKEVLRMRAKHVRSINMIKKDAEQEKQNETD